MLDEINGEEQMDAANCIYGKGRRFVPFIYLNQKPLGTFGDLYKLHQREEVRKAAGLPEL